MGIYHVGTTEDAPVWAITMGFRRTDGRDVVVCFPRETARWVARPRSSRDQVFRQVGDFVELADDDLAQLQAVIAEHVVRWTQGHERGTVHRRTGDGFYPLPDDAPMGAYLYLEPAAEGHRQGVEPGMPIDGIMRDANRERAGEAAPPAESVVAAARRAKRSGEPMERVAPNAGV